MPKSDSATLDRVVTVAALYADLDPDFDLVASVERRLEWRRARSGKRCPRCERTLPLAAFGRDASRAEGLTVYCRECRSRSRALV